MASRQQVIFFGATNELSRATFDSLVSGNVDVLAVIVSSKTAAGPLGRPLERLYPAKIPGGLPLISPFHSPNLLHAAWSLEMPVYSVGRDGTRELLTLMKKLRPSAACVACFPARLPIDLISLPPLGFLNVHPSLLPAYRGPAPLFWLFQKGDLEKRGVSVHLMDATLDSGPLVAQQKLEFADGLGQITIERICGELGGELLLRALDSLDSGHKGQQQGTSGSYFPWPLIGDYALDLSWPARQAFNFMRATNGARLPYTVSTPGHNLVLAEALEFSEHGRLSAPVEIDDLVARVQFRPGTLRARLSPLS